MIKLIDREPIPESWKNGYLKILDPVIRFFAGKNVHPNTFTTLGFVLGCVAGYFAVKQLIKLSSLTLLISGIFDSVDGKLARDSGKVTKFGALYDSTLDRYSEAIFFFGVAYYFIQMNMHTTALVTAVALGGSLMVSYIRARAEGLGFDCKVGILQRPERILLIGIGGLIHQMALVVAIWIVAVLSNITAIVRMVHVWREDRRRREI